MPVTIAGRQGIITAAVVQGKAPRPTLKSLRARIDFGTDRLNVFDDQVMVPLQTNEAGQYILELLEGFESDEVLMTATDQIQSLWKRLWSPRSLTPISRPMFPSQKPFSPTSSCVVRTGAVSMFRMFCQITQSFGPTFTKEWLKMEILVKSSALILLL